MVQITNGLILLDTERMIMVEVLHVIASPMWFSLATSLVILSLPGHFIFRM